MWKEFRDWLQEPYKDDMSAFNWFLFIGLLIILTLGWRFILAHLRGVTTAITE